MRRRAVLVRLNKEAELRFDLLVGELERAEHSLLQLGVCDSHRAARKLHAVEREVVRLRDDLRGVGVEVLYAVLLGHGERVVHGYPLAAFLVLLKEREVYYPDELELVGNDIEPLCDLESECAEGRENSAVFVGNDKDNVALLCAETVVNRRKLVVGHEFFERGVRLVDPSHVGETLCTDAADVFGEFVNLFAGIG